MMKKRSPNQGDQREQREQNAESEGKVRSMRKVKKVWNITQDYLKIFFSELIGTSVILFLGCMSLCKGISDNDKVGILFVFSFAVLMGIQIGLANSGGHVNPAVTVLSLFFKKIPYYAAPVYVLGQLIGGIVGFGLLKAVTPSSLLNYGYVDEPPLCVTAPNPKLSLVQAVLFEFLATSLLLLMVCAAWDPRNTHLDSFTLKFGATIFGIAYAGAEYTGCSMNPARSFAPAVWNNSWKDHWVYWVGPIAAALFWGFVYTWFLFPRKTQTTEGQREVSPVN